MANQVQSGLATGSEGLVCFVCDVGVVGRYYALATCRTQTTKVRLIEKLGQLVGDDYMVVISEDDVICRGCATMINSLDRLEKEVGSLRSIVLRYLEKKYDMEDGELVNARANSQCQAKPVNKGSIPFVLHSDYSRKRKAISSEMENDETSRDKGGKDNVWLQCDRCKYTTHYNSYMVHHVRTHNKERGPNDTVVATAPVTTGAGNTVPNQLSNQQERATPTPPPPSTTVAPTVEKQQNGEEKPAAVIHIQATSAEEEHQIRAEIEEAGEIKKDLSSMSEGSETVEMIAAEIGHDFTGTDDAVTAERAAGMLLGEGTGKQVTLQAVEGEDGGNTLCMVDENGMIVQKVEQAEDGTLYVQMADNTDPTKQVLSVGEDGSVQMVEVLWDDMVNADESEAHSMVTF
ncbi:hypothetical protein AAG570_012077 [Ranatra chinensis]|uniref:C2H2-type domain-containing protein n=1 Tax=Ranatra chinensis TaxID=642074 RepID=A0ABD0YI21_9HEMI